MNHYSLIWRLARLQQEEYLREAAHARLIAQAERAYGRNRSNVAALLERARRHLGLVLIRLGSGLAGGDSANAQTWRG